MDVISDRAAGITYLRRDGASDQTVVLLHGIGSNARSFLPVIERLPADWRIIAWNAPGYGGSMHLAEDWPAAARYADALARLLDALAIGHAAVAGHSLGALMAASFAVHHPARTQNLLLASPALGHGASPGSVLPAPAAARLESLERLGPEAFADEAAARLVHQPEAYAEAVFAVRREMAAIDPRGYGQAVRMLASGLLLDDAARLAVPAAVIVGEQDAVTPPGNAARLHAAIPAVWRGPLTVVPQVGHALAAQAPDAFVSAITACVRMETNSNPREAISHV